MKLIKFTVNLAFSSDKVTTDAIRNLVADLLRDATEAEVMFTSDAIEHDVMDAPSPWGDLETSLDNDAIEAWQARARTELERLHPPNDEESVDRILAKAMDVFGNRWLRWLISPVRGLGEVTPLSLLTTEEGRVRLMDILVQMEHGVW